MEQFSLLFKVKQLHQWLLDKESVVKPHFASNKILKTGYQNRKPAQL